MGGRSLVGRAPENGVTGTSIRQAGGWWTAADTVGYTVQHAATGSTRAPASRTGTCSGPTPLSTGRLRGGWRTFTRKRGLAIVTGDQGTPLNFFILGSRAGEGWVRSAPRGRDHGLYTSDRGDRLQRRPPTGRAWSGATPRSTGSHGTSSIGCASGRSHPRALPCDTAACSRWRRAGHFHVDTAGCRRDRSRCVAGHAAGTGARRAGKAGAHAQGADALRAEPVTVTVTVMDAERPVAFGTLTFVRCRRRRSQDRRSRVAAGDGDARRAVEPLCTDREPATDVDAVPTGSVRLLAGRRRPAGRVVRRLRPGASAPTGRIRFDERFTLDTSGRYPPPDGGAR